MVTSSCSSGQFCSGTALPEALWIQGEPGCGLFRCIANVSANPDMLFFRRLGPVSCLLPKHQSPAAPDCPCLSCPVFQLRDKEGPPPCLGTSTGQWGEEQAAGLSLPGVPSGGCAGNGQLLLVFVVRQPQWRHLGGCAWCTALSPCSSWE